MIVVCEHYYLEVIYKQLRPQPDALLVGGYLQAAKTPVRHIIVVCEHYYLEVIYKQLKPQPDALLVGGYLQMA